MGWCTLPRKADTKHPCHPRAMCAPRWPEDRDLEYRSCWGRRGIGKGELVDMWLRDLEGFLKRND